jgi:antitoxin MazE
MMMNATIQKWGNSLAIRLPKKLLKEVGLDDNSDIEIKVVGQEIHLIPVKKFYYTLDELLEGMTDENRHDEISTGSAVGNEIW